MAAAPATSTASAPVLSSQFSSSRRHINFLNYHRGALQVCICGRGMGQGQEQEHEAENNPLGRVQPAAT